MARFLVLLAVFLPLAMSMAPIYRVKPEKRIFNSYIVNLKETANLEALLERASQTARSHNIDFQVMFRYAALNGFSARMPAKLVELIANMDGVNFIEEDQEVSLSAVGSWGLDRSDQRNLPLDNSYSPAGNGAGVNVYVVDTGIKHSHVDFGGRASFFFDAVNSADRGEDCNGHGTHCAGTVGGSAYGIAKNVNLFSVRVLNCWGSGSNSGVIAGMDAVTAGATSPAVASMSLGGGASLSTDLAVGRMKAAGITVVVAAGNENTDACNSSPARSSDAITVAASDSSDRRSSFSNYGSCVQIFAPGTDITSTWYTGNRATNTISGTSMACPHVAGAAAIVLGKYPSYSPSAVESKLLGDSSLLKISDVAGSPNKLLYVD